jgi:hypothetical protein
VIFVNKEVARNLLQAELTRLRSVPYADWFRRLEKPQTTEVLGSDGIRYQIEVQAFWDGMSGGDIRVMGGIDDGGVSAFIPMTDSFIISPDGRFVGE